MNEVLNNNFQKLYPEIEEALKGATFLTIDSEFTGIKLHNEFRESLFDSNEDRYTKLRENIQPYIIIQIGITAFRHSPNNNQYDAVGYNFYLLPRSVPSTNRAFLWQVSALEFLSTYDFDFNKVAYNGIPYLNEEDQALFKKHLFGYDLLKNINRDLTYRDEDELRDWGNKVSEWLNSKNRVEPTLRIKTVGPLLHYLMHKELRLRFDDIWTVPGDNFILVVKIYPSVRKILEKQEGEALEKALLESYVGFSKVFKLLTTLKKPIIGHNMLLDLMFMYQQFHKPLPKKYTEFKRDIHTFFPTIYDTKHLSFELRETLEKEVKWKINSLGGLYEYFRNGCGKFLSLNSPNVVLINRKDTDIENYHNAGWDSYIAGYVFIKMAHKFAVDKFGEGMGKRVITNTELMNSVNNVMNCVNVIRGNLSYVKLDGFDPPSSRPQWLRVTPLRSKVVSASQIAETLGNFGTVDIMPYSRRKLLVAVANHGSARDILQHFRYNKDLSIVPYNPIRHSISTRLFLWSGVIVSGGMLAWVLHRTLQKTV